MRIQDRDMTYTISDFLKKYNAFKSVVPDVKKWNEDDLQENTFHYYSFLELQAMVVAFDIGNDLWKDVYSCKFLNRRTKADLSLFFADVEKYAATNEDAIQKEQWRNTADENFSGNRFGMVFQHLFRFSLSVYKFLKFNNGWLEAGFVDIRYSIAKTQNFFEHLDLKELNEIEAILCQALDPKAQIFRRLELIRDFDFPDVDLKSIYFESLYDD